MNLFVENLLYLWKIGVSFEYPSEMVLHLDSIVVVQPRNPSVSLSSWIITYLLEILVQCTCVKMIIFLSKCLKALFVVLSGLNMLAHWSTKTILFCWLLVRLLCKSCKQGTITKTITTIALLVPTCTFISLQWNEYVPECLVIAIIPIAIIIFF